MGGWGEGWRGESPSAQEFTGGKDASVGHKSNTSMRLKRFLLLTKQGLRKGDSLSSLSMTVQIHGSPSGVREDSSVSATKNTQKSFYVPKGLPSKPLKLYERPRTKKTSVSVCLSSQLTPFISEERRYAGRESPRPR